MWNLVLRDNVFIQGNFTLNSRVNFDVPSSELLSTTSSLWTNHVIEKFYVIGLFVLVNDGEAIYMKKHIEFFILPSDLAKKGSGSSLHRTSSGLFK